MLMFIEQMKQNDKTILIFTIYEKNSTLISKIQHIGTIIKHGSSLMCGRKKNSVHVKINDSDIK